MKLTLNQINSLPQKTWRWLGVNQKEIGIDVPEGAACVEASREGTPEKGVEITLWNPQNGSAWDTPPEGQGGPNKVLTGGAGKETEEFIRVNRNSGISVKVAAGKRLKAPLVFRYELNENNPVVIDENMIVAEKNSEVTVVLSYASGDGIKVFHGGHTKLYVEENAVVHLIQVQMIGDGGWHFDDVGAVVAENGTVGLIQAELGALDVTAGCRAQLLGNGSALNIRSIYLGDKERSIDINYIASHEGKNSESDISVRGALLDRSEKIFRGTIDFKKGAAGAKGREEEYSILLSPNVRNRTAPLILCSEEDVDGQHAASTGRIDENKLFYLMSRGLTEVEAKKMVIEAEFEPITGQIPVADLKTAISDQVRKKLSKVE